MTSSIGTGAHGDYKEEARLRRRVVAGGYLSAHSCQHCDELVIIPHYCGSGPEYSERPDTIHETIATREQVRQRAATGCQLWSLVSDEIDHEILKHKRGDVAVGTSGDVALSDDDTRTLERFHNRCLKRATYSAFAEARVDCVKLWFDFESSGSRSAGLSMRIRAYENGLRYNIHISFTVFGLPGGPQISSDRYAVALPANVDPRSTQSFELMRTWIQKCALEHGCGIEDHYPSSMPSMLLGVGEVDKCGLIKLVEMIPGEKQLYLALSYCWGPNSQKKMLTKANRAEFIRDGIRLEELDATIQDAIRVTRELGYLYLWIDALCIIQDDIKYKDDEIGRMESIYENASITIVAARASSVSEGFLTPRQPAGSSTPNEVFKVAYKHLRQRQRTADNWVILIPEEEGDWFSPREPWESRAWTLQEDLMSGRQLRFGTKQTSWVCRCSKQLYEDFDGWFRADFEHARLSLNEGQPGRLARILQQPDLNMSVHDARKAWYDLVETYSQRSLSFQKDSLPAISAISRRMAYIFGDEYWCGLWKSEAPWELLWNAHRPAVDATCAQEMDHERRSEPSWTWASQDIGVRFLSWSDGHQSFRVDVNFEIVEHVAKYTSPKHTYGAVTAAQLRVRGLVTPAPFELQECHATGSSGEPTRKLKQDMTKQSAEGPGDILRQIFLDKGIVSLDRWPCDLLANPKLDIKNKQIVLLMIGYHVSRSYDRKTKISGPRGLVLLNESGDKFSRLGTFDVGEVDAVRSVYYGAGYLTLDVYIEKFLYFWGGRNSVEEIVII